MRLVAFSALGGFAAAHWGAFVTDPPVGRMLLVLARCHGRRRRARAARPRADPAPRRPRRGRRDRRRDAGARPDGGRPARQAAPPGALGRAVRRPRPRPRGSADRGLALRRRGIRGSGSPCCSARPPCSRSRAVLAFWPARRGTHALRAAGLFALLLMYGTAVAERDPGQPALRGLVLLVLLAAWLWLPRLPRREAVLAGVVVASVGVLSLPVAAALDTDRAWWDYHGRGAGSGRARSSRSTGTTPTAR